MQKQRPKHLDLAKIRLPVPGIVSILHRVSGVALKLFGGVMLGVFFHMLNGLFSSLGVINSWPPLASAFAPTILFMFAAGAMLWWVERR